MRLNEIWALEFMVDALYGGRAFSTPDVIDEGNREALGVEILTPIPSVRVIRVMEQLIEMQGTLLAHKRLCRVQIGAAPDPNSDHGRQRRDSSINVTTGQDVSG
jgi:hypothetical protein